LILYLEFGKYYYANLCPPDPFNNSKSDGVFFSISRSSSIPSIDCHLECNSIGSLKNDKGAGWL
jgi:hypothetical protein